MTSQDIQHQMQVRQLLLRIHDALILHHDADKALYSAFLGGDTHPKYKQEMNSTWAEITGTFFQLLRLLLDQDTYLVGHYPQLSRFVAGEIGESVKEWEDRVAGIYIGMPQERVKVIAVAKVYCLLHEEQQRLREDAHPLVHSFRLYIEDFQRTEGTIERWLEEMVDGAAFMPTVYDIQARFIDLEDEA